MITLLPLLLISRSDHLFGQLIRRNRKKSCKSLSREKKSSSGVDRLDKLVPILDFFCQKSLSGSFSSTALVLAIEQVNCLQVLMMLKGLFAK